MYWLITALKLTPFVVVFSIGWYVNGWRYDVKIDKMRNEQVNKERAAQIATDKVRKEKTREVEAINNRLNAALVELRNRPTRTELSSNGQNGTGSSLSAEDAGFLIGEAARADKIRIALDACYKQYDEVTK